MEQRDPIRHVPPRRQGEADFCYGTPFAISLSTIARILHPYDENSPEDFTNGPGL